MESRYTTLVHPWGCALGQPVMQALALAYEGNICCPTRESNKRPTHRFVSGLQTLF